MESGFRMVRLKTKAGELVTDIEIPPFDPPPDVIVWGERFFQYDIMAGSGFDYRECFAWFYAKTGEPVDG